MPQSRNAPGESFGHYFLGTFVSNDIEQTAVVVISLAGIEVFRIGADQGLTRVSGVAADLTAREWRVVEALVMRAGRTVSKADLESLVLVCSLLSSL